MCSYLAVHPDQGERHHPQPSGKNQCNCASGTHLGHQSESHGAETPGLRLPDFAHSQLLNGGAGDWNFVSLEQCLHLGRTA